MTKQNQTTKTAAAEAEAREALAYVYKRTYTKPLQVMTKRFEESGVTPSTVIQHAEVAAELRFIYSELYWMATEHSSLSAGAEQLIMRYNHTVCRLEDTLVRNRLRHSSTSALSIAVTEVKRAACATLLQEMRGIEKYISCLEAQLSGVH